MCLLWGGRDGCRTAVLLSHDKLALMTVTAGNTVMAHNEPVQTNCRVHRYVGNMNTLILASAAARRVPVHRPAGRLHPALSCHPRTKQTFTSDQVEQRLLGEAC